VIIRGQTDEKVHGLTTAAAVWTTAALGALCGIGAWKVIVVLVIVVWAVLLFGASIERALAPGLRRQAGPIALAPAPCSVSCSSEEIMGVMHERGHAARLIGPQWNARRVTNGRYRCSVIVPFSVSCTFMR
jgi:uncharacterized membrane protein YhiD involved in acid resistance